MTKNNQQTRAQLLIFDLDGTLVDSRRDLAAGVNHMRAHYGLSELPLEVVSSYIGDGVRSLVERSLQGTDVDVEEALRINKAYYRSHLVVHTETYPGVHEGIRALADAGHTLALLTNKPGDASRLLMKHFELDAYFTLMIGGGDVENLKPAADGVLEILKTTGMCASQAWMIGDHHTDIAVAQNAGIRSVFVRYGFGDRLGLKPDFSCNSFSELVRFYI